MTAAADRPSRPRPAEAIRRACRRWGEPEVARRCAGLLDADGAATDGVDRELLGYLAATPSLTAPTHAGWPAWHPVWAVRGLRYAWHPDAAPAVLAALHHPQWRVREMAAHVCRSRELGESGDRLVPLTSDPVPRVRVAAARALAAVGEAEHANALRQLREDPDPRCRHHAVGALRQLAARLDRDLEDRDLEDRDLEE